MSIANFPPSLNLADIKASAVQEADGQFLRYRSDNSSYSNGDTIRIEIPCGRRGQYLHPQDGFMEYKMVAGTSTITAGSLYLDGNCLTYFKTLRILHGSNLLVNIPEYGRICHAMYDCQVSISERNSTGTVGMGVGSHQSSTGDDDLDIYQASLSGVFGHLISNGCSYQYSHPLMCPILGSLTSKAIPLGWLTSSLYLELVLEDVNKCVTTRFGSSITGSRGAATTSNPSVATMTFKDIYYNAKVTQLNPMYDSLLLDAFQGRKVLIPSVDFKGEMKSIASGSSAFSDKFSFQLSSVKFLWWWLTNTSTANGTVGTSTVGVQYNYASAITQRMMGALSSYNLSFNGTMFPSNPISCSVTGHTIKQGNTAANFQFGAVAYQHLLRTLNQNSDYTAGGVISKPLFCNNLTTAVDDHDNGKRAILAIDLDRFDGNNDKYMMGYNSNNQNVVLQATWDTALAENCNLYAFVQHDVAYEIKDGLLFANN